MLSRSSAKLLVIGITLALLAGCGKSSLPETPSGVAGSAFWTSAQRPSASGFATIYSFGPSFSTGLFPTAGLIVDRGALFGTTYSGGMSGNGTVFKVFTSGEERVLYSFKGLDYADGSGPANGVTAVANSYYGTTVTGGSGSCFVSGSPSPFNVGCGTIFKVSGSGDEDVLLSFSMLKDGAWPEGGLTLLDGTLYGTTYYGGHGHGCEEIQYIRGCGTVFSASLSGKERVLHEFTGGTDGRYPQGNLTAYNGALYGVTRSGNVFSVTPARHEHVVYRFKSSNDGAVPNGGMVVVHDMFYGTTEFGGSANYGTVFRLTHAGKERVLYSFKGGQDGENPTGGLIYVNGELYGTTNRGGGLGCNTRSGDGCGTIFKISLSGDEVVLYPFAHRGLPYGDLVELNGELYGTTNDAGKHRRGSVFRISP